MAVVEIGGSDDGGLSIGSVGFRGVVQIRAAGHEGKAVDVAYSAVELAVSRPYGLAGIVQTHPDWTCLCSYIQRRKEIVICLALPVAESASPQSTLIISKLKNKYPKKYPKRAFSGTFFVMA